MCDACHSICSLSKVLTGVEVKVLLDLVEQQRPGSFRVVRSLPQIEEATGVSRRGLQVALEKLNARGLLCTVTGKGTRPAEHELSFLMGSVPLVGGAKSAPLRGAESAPPVKNCTGAEIAPVQKVHPPYQENARSNGVGARGRAALAKAAKASKKAKALAKENEAEDQLKGVIAYEVMGARLTLAGLPIDEPTIRTLEQDCRGLPPNIAERVKLRDRAEELYRRMKDPQEPYPIRGWGLLVHIVRESIRAAAKELYPGELPTWLPPEKRPPLGERPAPGPSIQELGQSLRSMVAAKGMR